MTAVDSPILGANLYLLIGLLLLAGISALSILVFWTSIKLWIWRRAQRRSEQAYQQRRFDHNGTPYPPASRGICTHCGELYEQVYHLPSGARLCRNHYHNATRTQTPSTDREHTP